MIEIEPSPYMYGTVTLPDGTVYSKCPVNGNYFKLPEPVTQADLNAIPDGPITIQYFVLDEEGNEHEENTAGYGDHTYLAGMFEPDDEYAQWVAPTPRDPFAILQDEYNAKIDFLAMMLDIDLDEE